jgi:hypothetical protein
MMDLSTFQWVEMAIFNSAGLTGTFQPLNGPSSYTIFTGSGFQEVIRSLKVYNGSTSGVIVSFDGVTNNDFWPAGATIILDIQANHKCHSSYSSGTLLGRKGEVIFGMGAAGTGNIYISGYY